MKTLNELKQKTSKVFTYMDKYYNDEVMYGRITLARQLAKDIYKQEIPLENKITLVQDLIDKTAYTSNKNFKI